MKQQRGSRVRAGVRCVVAGLSFALMGVYVGVPSGTAQSASTFRVTNVATATQPLAIVWHPVSKAPFVVEQGGRIRSIDLSKKAATGNVLDVSKDVTTSYDQGLLGAAFSPNGQFLYVNLINAGGDTEIREYRWANAAAVVGSKRVVLTIDQPYENHNGGHLLFDRKGLLWIGMGDGGSQGDPENRSQNTNVLLGKMLRIDPRPNGQRAYGIPEDNPWAGASSASKGRPEIWALGLRMPWRYDFDERTNQLFIADVGQSTMEEVDVISTDRKSSPPNFGWKIKEGTSTHDSSRPEPSGLVGPITEYGRADGCSITGGVVYRGKKLPGLDGYFLYGDFCQGWIRAVGKEPGSQSWTVKSLGLTFEELSSFNRAPDGEVWITSTSGTIARIDKR
jgi:glucose/arabinose dehydrogenase